MSRLSSAKSYASTSGATSPAVSIGSSTSGSSSSSSYELSSVQRTLSPEIQRFRNSGVPQYADNIRQPGDIFIHIRGDKAGHTNMVCQDVTQKVDSVDGGGVRTMPMTADRHPALVYRFSDAAVALRAALLAESWGNNVGYSDGPTAGIGITGRVLSALMGSSNFGIGAQARLLKYRSRNGMTPKNVICSEMCILAYQLSMQETDAGFIKLDAKHSIPSTLLKYLKSNPTYWTLVAYR